MTSQESQVPMKIRRFVVSALIGLCGLQGAAQAVIPEGVLPPSMRQRPGPAVAVPEMQSGTITGVRSDARQIGTQIEVAGKWLLVMSGRTVVLRKGVLVGADTLRVGQTVKFSMATLTPGETALGVVDVP